MPAAAKPTRGRLVAAGVLAEAVDHEERRPGRTETGPAPGEQRGPGSRAAWVSILRHRCSSPGAAAGAGPPGFLDDRRRGRPGVVWAHDHAHQHEKPADSCTGERRSPNRIVGQA